MCAHTYTFSSLIITLNYNPYISRSLCLTRLMQYAALLSHEHTENSLLAVWLVEGNLYHHRCQYQRTCDGIQMDYVHVFALWVSVS